MSGDNLTYSITPRLPMLLSLDPSNGDLNGYITGEFDTVEETIIIKNEYGITNFTFSLSSLIEPYPIVVESSIIQSVEFTVNEKITATLLFQAVGTNLSITVFPELPQGIKLNHKSGVIYGKPQYYTPPENYSFIISNPPSLQTVVVKVQISLNGLFCDSDSGFPKTYASEEGTKSTISCNKNRKGNRIRLCYIDEGSTLPYWGEIKDECSLSDHVLTLILVLSISVSIIIIIVLILIMMNKCNIHFKSNHHSITPDSLLVSPFDTPVFNMND